MDQPTADNRTIVKVPLRPDQREWVDQMVQAHGVRRGNNRASRPAVLETVLDYVMGEQKAGRLVLPL